jgi:hypothetical protein
MTQPLPFPVFDGFTAAASLSLSTDGPIDPHHLALAHAYDLARVGTEPRRARIGKVTLKPSAIVSIMATVIEKAAVRSGTVHRLDFKQLGLRDDEIDRHFPEAFLRASQRRPGLYSSEAA